MGAEVIPVESGGRDAQGRDQRGAARLGGELRRHPLSARHRRRPASLPDHGARVSAGDRPRGARPDPRRGRAAARRGDRLRRRRLERDRPLRRFPPDDGVRLIGVEAGGQGSTAASTARPCCAATRASCTAPRPTSFRTRTGRSATAGRSRPGSIIPRSAPSTPSSRTAAAPNMSAPTDARRSTPSRAWPGRGHRLRLRIGPRAGARAQAGRGGARGHGPGRQPLGARRQGHGAGPAPAGARLMDRYAAMFARLARRGEGAFGAFVMLGDPDLETSAQFSTRWSTAAPT